LQLEGFVIEEIKGSSFCGFVKNRLIGLVDFCMTRKIKQEVYKTFISDIGAVKDAQNVQELNEEYVSLSDRLYAEIDRLRIENNALMIELQNAKIEIVKLESRVGVRLKNCTISKKLFCINGEF